MLVCARSSGNVDSVVSNIHLIKQHTVTVTASFPDNMAKRYQNVEPSFLSNKYDDDAHLTTIFQDNPSKLVPEYLPILDFSGSKDVGAIRRTKLLSN